MWRGEQSQTNPRAYENKIGTPPSKNQKKHPKTRTFMGMEVSYRKNQKVPGAHRIGAAISGPRIEGEQFMVIRLF